MVESREEDVLRVKAVWYVVPYSALLELYSTLLVMQCIIGPTVYYYT